MNIKKVDKLIYLAIAEDISTGDITSDSCIDPKINIKNNAVARIISNETGILCGIEIAKRVCNIVDKKLKFLTKTKDGTKIKPNQVLAEIKGKATSILLAERIILNFLTMLSGVSTITNNYTEKIKKYNTTLLDTRKTIPGYRELSKYAVVCGGGTNHRLGLYDMVMIKDNHITAAGGITQAVERTKSKLKDRYMMEVETSTLKDVAEALDADVDIIMLDNMSVSDVKKAVKIIKKYNDFTKRIVKSEASGGIRLNNLVKYAKTGVDYISVGAITHSFKTLDIAMDIKLK